MASIYEIQLFRKQHQLINYIKAMQIVSFVHTYSVFSRILSTHFKIHQPLMEKKKIDFIPQCSKLYTNSALAPGHYFNFLWPLSNKDIFTNVTK